MTDRIVGYRVAAAVLGVVAVFAWLGYARAARDGAGAGVGVGLWLGTAVSATVFAAAAAVVGSVASLLRLQTERSAVHH